MWMPHKRTRAGWSNCSGQIRLYVLLAGRQGSAAKKEGTAMTAKRIFQSQKELRFKDRVRGAERDT